MTRNRVEGVLQEEVGGTAGGSKRGLAFPRIQHCFRISRTLNQRLGAGEGQRKKPARRRGQEGALPAGEGSPIAMIEEYFPRVQHPPEMCGAPLPPRHQRSVLYKEI